MVVLRRLSLGFGKACLGTLHIKARSVQLFFGHGVFRNGRFIFRLRDGSFFIQRHVPVVGQLNLLELRVLLCKLGFCLVESGFHTVPGRKVLVAFDLQQYLTCFYLVSFFNIQHYDLARYVGADLYLHHGLDLSVGRNDLGYILSDREVTVTSTPFPDLLLPTTTSTTISTTAAIMIHKTGFFICVLLILFTE